MRRKELVYREMLYQAIEKRNRRLTQAELSRSLRISLSTVNHAVKPLKSMGAVRVKLRGLEVVDVRKILLYWASIRDLEKDIIYKTRMDKPVTDIEKNMPGDIMFGAYSAYKFIFKRMPADYSEVYVYSNNLAEIKKRFPENKNIPNLFVLKKEFDNMTLAHLFVDLWNLKEWYAKEFLKEMEDKLKL